MAKRKVRRVKARKTRRFRSGEAKRKYEAFKRIHICK
jgi:hypothetical protein